MAKNRKSNDFNAFLQERKLRERRGEDTEEVRRAWVRGYRAGLRSAFEGGDNLVRIMELERLRKSIKKTIPYGSGTPEYRRGVRQVMEELRTQIAVLVGPPPIITS